MENNQPQNKIDLFTDFLTVHNTTIIAIIMAITAMTSQHYHQQEEDVIDRQEAFDDIQADLEAIRLQFGEESPQYKAALTEYLQEEEELLQEAMESMDSDMEDFDFENLDSDQDMPEVQQGRIPQDVTTPDYGGQDGGQADYNQQDAVQQDAVQQDGGQQDYNAQPQGDQPEAAQQEAAQPEAAQADAGQADAGQQQDWDQMEKKFDAVADAADQRSDLSGFASILLQISVLLSSAGGTAKSKLLVYGASLLTLLGVIIEIIVAAFV